MNYGYCYCGYLSILLFLLLTSNTSVAFVGHSVGILKDTKHLNQRQKQNNSPTTTTLNLISNGIDYSFLKSSSAYDNKEKLSKEKILDEEQLQYITKLVNKRSDARTNGQYDLADSIRDEIISLCHPSLKIDGYDSGDSTKQEWKRGGIPSVPKGYIIEIKDIPRKEGGGSTWTLQYYPKHSMECITPRQKGGDQSNDTATRKSKGYMPKNSTTSSTVLKLAHEALGLASWSSEHRIPLNHDKLNDLVLKAKKRILHTGSRELRGRKAADAAFWFAMAGVKDDDMQTVKGEVKDFHFSLFDALTFICIDELRRFGKRSSCRATDIMHMVERIAASGIQSEMSICLQKEAAECLLTKDLVSSSGFKDAKAILQDLQNGHFHLHSERPLLWIWRFSTRQRKQQAFLRSASKHWESKNSVHETKNQFSLSTSGQNSYEEKWEHIFDDPSKPLVLDIGCGMGISMLGLACYAHKDDYNPKEEHSVLNLNWSQCNFLGADLSQLAINYATSVSHRWKLKGNVHFELASAEEIVEEILHTYPGKIQLCSIQFPTPFSFQEETTFDLVEEKDDNSIIQSVVKHGNSQLPSSAVSGFMVTSQLLNLIHQVLDPSIGRLILQSNCEDVAVFMKNVAVNEVGFQTIDVPNFVHDVHDENGMTMRTKKWIERGGERAEGPCWSSSRILPSVGATETEIACALNGTPVHRCILQK